MIKDYIRALRPKQWSKNLLLFAGLIFAQKFFDLNLVLKAVAAFITFCFTASSIYLINDIRDIESDKLHPVKCLRPIASGKIPRNSAVRLAVILAVCSLACAFLIDRKYGALLLLYFAAMMAYNFFLKHIVIIDILIIAGGFILRAVAGAVVVEVSISSWLLVCTTFLALFMVISKRRHEIISLGDNAANHRKILEEYGEKFLDQMISIVTASTIMAYMLYTVDQTTIAKFGTHNLLLTSPLVLFGIFRYLYLVYQRNMGGHPELILLNDPPLIITIIIWIISVFIIIY